MHVFEFELSEAFFAHFPESGIHQAEVSVRIEMNRQERHLEFSFTLQGWIMLPCDRCLEEYRQSITGTFNLYGKFGHGSNEDEFDVIWIAYDASQVDLSHYLYEYVVLSLPMRKIHPDLPDGQPGCNPEMIDLLKNLSVT